MMLWIEPASLLMPPGGGTRNGTQIRTAGLDPEAYGEIRRFVVIKEGYGNSICS